MKKKIGILGGTFDPPHKGHLKISLSSIKKIKLDKLYWIITKKNPFKNKSFFSLKERIIKCEKIIKKNKKIKIKYLDKTIKSSRTIDALKFINKEVKFDLFFIIGSDNLINFHKWRSWKKITKLAKLIVFSRNGFEKKSKNSPLVKYLHKDRIIYIKDSKIDISSSKLRKIYLK
jgi:nicotinate-nucleotide adenylyltransferase